MKFTLEKKTSLVVTLLGITDIREKISLFSSAIQTQLSNQKEEKCYNLLCAHLHHFLSVYNLSREVIGKEVLARIAMLYFQERGLANMQGTVFVTFKEIRYGVKESHSYAG